MEVTFLGSLGQYPSDKFPVDLAQRLHTPGRAGLQRADGLETDPSARKRAAQAGADPNPAFAVGASGTHPPCPADQSLPVFASGVERLVAGLFGTMAAAMPTLEHHCRRRLVSSAQS